GAPGGGGAGERAQTRQGHAGPELAGMVRQRGGSAWAPGWIACRSPTCRTSKGRRYTWAVVKVRSSPRKRGPSFSWIPAFAGMSGVSMRLVTSSKKDGGNDGVIQSDRDTV